VRERLYDYIKAICHAKNCDAKIVNGVEDHLHMLVSLHKNISLSKLIEEIKRSSSKWIKALDSSLHQFYWQCGYGAFSVSQSNLERVELYIKNQYQHHQKQSFQDELRKFLIQHNVTYDENYLWN
jgi:putative transposase